MTTATAPALTDLTGTYTLDPAHTRIGFVARHAMVTKVRGAFNEFQGTATLDGANPANSGVQVMINAASIDTRNAQRDEHLRAGVRRVGAVEGGGALELVERAAHLRDHRVTGDEADPGVRRVEGVGAGQVSQGGGGRGGHRVSLKSVS